MNSDDVTTLTEPTMTADWLDRDAYDAWQAECAAKYAAGPRKIDRISRADPLTLPRRFRRSHRHVGNSRRDHNE